MTVRSQEHKEMQLTNSEGVFKVMHQILMREEENDMGREHFWIISLFRNNRIMNIELKKAAKVILVHNHPSGELTPSEEDKDITDMLIQTGRVIHEKGKPAAQHDEHRTYPKYACRSILQKHFAGHQS
jgi:DNA repair protein RadC